MENRGIEMKENGQEIPRATDIVRKMKNRFIWWKTNEKAESESDEEDGVKNHSIGWKLKEKGAKESAKKDKVKNRAKDSTKGDKMDMPIDRISALPDELLLHILSHFDVRDAVITSVLSKRWQFLWRDMPRLLFLERNRPVGGCHFVASVHRALAVRGSNRLDKFELDFNYDDCFAPDVTAWIHFCVNNKVKNVELMLNTDNGRILFHK